MKLSRIWKFVLVVSLVLVTAFVGATLAQAGDDPFTVLRQTLAAQDLPVVSLNAVQYEGNARVDAVVQSKSTGASLTAEDKAVEEKILRHTALAKNKNGLDVDELALTVLNSDQKVIFTMVRPLDVPLDPVWEKTPAMGGDEVEQTARQVIEKEYDFSGLVLDSVRLSAVDDGMRSLDVAVIVTDQELGPRNLADFLRRFRWSMKEVSLSQGAMVGVIHINADDKAGNPLVRFTIDLQVGHDQGWFAPGMVIPGSNGPNSSVVRAG